MRQDHYSLSPTCSHMESSHITVTSMLDSKCIRRTLNSSTGSVHYSGLCIAILNYICEQHNLTYEVDVLNVKDWGVLFPDGNWSGKY